MSAQARNATIIAVAAVMAWLGAWLNFQFYDEDSLIIVRFVRNLALHGELSFNIGDPTYSITCPLWAILLASIRAALPFAINERVFAAVTAGLAALLTLNVLWRCARLSRIQTPALLLFALALDPLFHWGVAQGNEMPLFLSLMFSALYAYRSTGGRARGSLATGLLIGLAFLCRPEAGAMLVIVCLDSMLLRGPGWARRILIICLGAAAVVLPWLLFAKHSYGTIIPLTVLAKSAVQSTNWLTPLKFFSLGIARLYFIPFGLILVALLVSLRRGTDRDLFRAARIEMAWIVSVLLAFLIGLRETSIPNRYFLVFSPFLLLLATELLPVLSRRWNGNRACYLLYSVWILWLVLINVPYYQSRSARNREYLPYLEASNWAESNLPSNSRIYVEWLGGPAWLTNHFLVDSGIITREGVRYRRGELSRSELMTSLRPTHAIQRWRGTGVAGEEVLYLTPPRIPEAARYSVVRYFAPRDTSG